MSEQNIPSEHSTRATIAMPSAPSALTPGTEAVPACSVCGRQDETLRFVVYPFVFSVVVMTFRRAFVGVWCQKHRNLRLALASLITATIGWLGIPFGFILTPIALFKLAQGGDQPVEPNVRLLKNLAEHKLKEGDPQEAIRCLEAALQLRDDETTQARLSELLRTHRPSTYERDHPQVLPFVGAMLGAAVVGAAIGILDNVIDIGLSLFGLSGKEIPIYLAILSWAPLVVMAFMGGLILSQLTRWALTRARCCQRSLSVGLAIVSASLALYGLPEIRAIWQYVQMLLSGLAFEPVSDTILTSGAVLTRGGVWVIWNAIKSGGTPGTIYALILLACAAYYVITSVSAATGTARWQQRIAAVREKAAAQTDWALAPGWVPIIAVVLGLAFFTGLFPQQGIVDYFEAIAHNVHGVELLEQSKPDEAVQEFQEAVRLKPSFAMAHSNLGWTYFNQGNYEAAVDEFEAAIELNPNDANTYKSLGFAYYWLGTVDMADTAAEAFEKALKLAPDDAEALAGLGLVCLVQEQLDDAESHLTAALELAPDLYLTHYGLGGLYLRKNNLDKAISHYQEAVRLNPQFSLAYHNLGWACYHQGELDQAIEAFQEAIHLDPDLAGAHVGLSFVYLSQDNYEAAIDGFETALKLDSNNAEAYRGLGQVYYYQGALDEAVQQLREAIRLNPQSLFAYLDLGWAYMGRAEFEEAVEQFETLIELQPDWGAPHAFLAYIYYQLDQLDLMEQELKQALELQAEDALTCDALATVYSNLRRFPEAEAQLLKAIELMPDGESVYRDLAYVYSAQRKFDLAWRMCDKALELHEDYADAYVVRSDIYVEQEKLDQALQELSRALELAPEKEEIHSYLSFVYFHKGQTAEALQEAREVVKLQPYSASGHTNLAFAYHAQGQLDLALAAAQEAVRLAPKSDRPHYILGLCYMDKGEKEQAVAEFEKFLELYWDRAYVRDYKVKAEAYLAQLQEEATTIAAVPPTAPFTPSAPPGMVYVPADEFIMGSTAAQVDRALALCNKDWGDCKRSWFESEQPQHTVYLDAFYIDQTEVTNAQYRECVEAGACSQPHDTGWYNDPNRAEHPVVYVDWHQANDYCRWAEKRLPTEAEWEKAARGTDGRVYPWGNTFDGSKLNFCDKNCPEDWRDASVDDGYADTAPVGSYPAGASPYGVLDMAGNVWEWVADWANSDYYSQSPDRNPPGPDSGKKRGQRGGSWSGEPFHVRNANRGWDLPDTRDTSVGFRCARGAE